LSLLSAYCLLIMRVGICTLHDTDVAPCTPGVEPKAYRLELLHHCIFRPSQCVYLFRHRMGTPDWVSATAGRQPRLIRTSRITPSPIVLRHGMPGVGYTSRKVTKILRLFTFRLILPRDYPQSSQMRDIWRLLEPLLRLCG